MLCGVVMIYNILSIIIVVIRHQFLKIDVLCYKERVTALGQSSSSARNFGFQNTSGWAGWLNTPLLTMKFSIHNYLICVLCTAISNKTSE